MQITIGTGGLTSAIVGAKTLTDRPIKLEKPIVSPRYLGSKYWTIAASQKYAVASMHPLSPTMPTGMKYTLLVLVATRINIPAQQQIK